MQQAHLHVVRVAEYAWTALEPEEGNYQLDWLERAINLAGQHGLSVILGTPSGAPPVWMATKYPDIMATDENGKPFSGETRNHYNWNSPRYRTLVREVDERLAARFGHNPYVIGWQIDNEYNRQSFDLATQAQFHIWLEDRYGTIAKLNQLWTTAYNNQTYSNFAQVKLISGSADNSPGLWLDSKRFISESPARLPARPDRRHPQTRRPPPEALHQHDGAGSISTTTTSSPRDLDIIGWGQPAGPGHLQPRRQRRPARPHARPQARQPQLLGA